MATVPSNATVHSSPPLRLRQGQIVGGCYELGTIIASSNYVTTYWARDISTSMHHCVLVLPKSRTFIFGGARKALQNALRG